jgi:hypothetical protein
VCLGNAFDDGEAEADTCVVGVYALGAALKRLDKGGDRLVVELLAGVLDSEHHMLRVNAGRDPYGALLGQVMDDRVVHEVRRQLEQERLGADGGGQLAGGFDGDAMSFCERKECFSGLFGDEGQVDRFWNEGSPVGAAQYK